MKTKTTTTPSPSLHRRGNRLVNNLNATKKRILPLWKGELEGVVFHFKF